MGGRFRRSDQNGNSILPYKLTFACTDMAFPYPDRCDRVCCGSLVVREGRLQECGDMSDNLLCGAAQRRKDLVCVLKGVAYHQLCSRALYHVNCKNPGRFDDDKTGTLVVLAGCGCRAQHEIFAGDYPEYNIVLPDRFFTAHIVSCEAGERFPHRIDFLRCG